MRDGAREHLHQRALPRAVLADDGVDLARVRLEIHRDQRLRRAERARDAADR